MQQRSGGSVDQVGRRARAGMLGQVVEVSPAGRQLDRQHHRRQPLGQAGRAGGL